MSIPKKQNKELFVSVWRQTLDNSLIFAKFLGSELKI
jgi:hypothetical protein